MPKIALVTDSTSYLPPAFKKEHDVRVVPLSVIFENDVFKEDVDLDATAFYQKVKMSPQLPTTSQPAAGDFVTVYEELVQDGYEEAIVVTLSSGISGTYNTAKSAAEMVE
ncbi:MAG TPA: DegV family protein, partial [Sporolactobacillaceae bacterium]|nr:DegV family protein [Sporolactobacillaceae bacterium]